MSLVFFGTPDFAVPTLERLIAEKFAIDLVVTNQDEPRGRGYEVKAPPVKQAALRAGIEHDHPKVAQTEWHVHTQLVVRQSSNFPRGTLPALVESASGKGGKAGAR